MILNTPPKARAYNTKLVTYVLKWRGPVGEGPSEKIHQRRPDKEDPAKKIRQRRSDGEDPDGEGLSEKMVAGKKGSLHNQPWL